MENNIIVVKNRSDIITIGLTDSLVIEMRYSNIISSMFFQLKILIKFVF